LTSLFPVQEGAPAQA